MNKTKRGLELAAAICGIVFGAWSGFIWLIWLSMESMVDWLLSMIYLLTIGLAIAQIVLGGILCTRLKNKARLGVGIALISVTVLNLFFWIFEAHFINLMTIGGFTVVGLEIASLCIKEHAQGTASGAAQAEVSATVASVSRTQELVRMRNAGFLTEEQFASALIKMLAEDKSGDCAKQIAEIVNLKKLDVISEQLAHDAVSAIINR